MPPTRLVRVRPPRVLPRGLVAALLPHDHGARFRLEQADEEFRKAELLREGEEVEEGGGVDDVEGALQGREGATPDGGGENVAGEEGGVEGGAVAEEVVAEVDEGGVEVGAVEVGGGDAGGDEGAEVLPEAAAEVEEEVGGGGEEGEDGGVEGVLGDGEVEEAELPDAGVGRYAPGAVADGEDVREDFGGRDGAVGFEEKTRRLADGGDVLFEPSDFLSWGLGSLGRLVTVVRSHG